MAAANNVFRCPSIGRNDEPQQRPHLQRSGRFRQELHGVPPPPTRRDDSKGSEKYAPTFPQDVNHTESRHNLSDSGNVPPDSGRRNDIAQTTYLCNREETLQEPIDNDHTYLSIFPAQVFLSVESLNIITGSHDQSHHFWNERLLPSVRSRFGDLAIDHAEECNIRLLLQPCSMYIIQRLQVWPHWRCPCETEYVCLADANTLRSI